MIDVRERPGRARTSAERPIPLIFAGLVVEAEDVPPDPISNSAVKASSAHGTVPQGTGESVTARPAEIRFPRLVASRRIPSSRSAPARAHPRARRGVEQPGSSSGS